MPDLIRHPGFPVKTGIQPFTWFPIFVGAKPGFRLPPDDIRRKLWCL